MTRDETKMILMTVQAAYPNYKPQNKTYTIDLWATMLKDYDLRDVTKALQAYIRIDTSGFAPSIGQIISNLSALTDVDGLTPMEAWAMVRKAIGNSGYHSQEEFDKLPPDVQKAVGSPQQLYYWALDTSFNANVAMSQFIKSYQIVQTRNLAISNMSKDILNLTMQTIASPEEAKPEEIVEQEEFE